MKGLFAWVGFPRRRSSTTATRRAAGDEQVELLAAVVPRDRGHHLVLGRAAQASRPTAGIRDRAIALATAAFMLVKTLLFGDPGAGLSDADRRDPASSAALQLHGDRRARASTWRACSSKSKAGRCTCSERVPAGGAVAASPILGSRAMSPEHPPPDADRAGPAADRRRCSSPVLARLATLGAYPLIDTDRGALREIARQMAELGDWVTPWIGDGVPFWGKPPLVVLAERDRIQASSASASSARAHRTGCSASPSPLWCGWQAPAAFPARRLACRHPSCADRHCS